MFASLRRLCGDWLSTSTNILRHSLPTPSFHFSPASKIAFFSSCSYFSSLSYTPSLSASPRSTVPKRPTDYTEWSVSAQPTLLTPATKLIELTQLTKVSKLASTTNTIFANTQHMTISLRAFHTLSRSLSSKPSGSLPKAPEFSYDRAHRAHKHRLERPVRYGARKVLLPAELPSVAVYCGRKGGPPVHITASTTARTCRTPGELVEPLLFHIAVILSAGPKIDLDTHLDHLTRHFDTKVVARHRRGVDFKVIDAAAAATVQAQYDEFCTKVKLAPVPAPGSPADRALRLALEKIIAVTSLESSTKNPPEPGKPLTEVAAWIISIGSRTVTDSCFALENLTDIPPCVTGALLLRSPRAGPEFYLQADMWAQFSRSLAVAWAYTPRKFPAVINNLTFFAGHIDPSKLPLVVQELRGLPRAVAVRVITPDYANDLMWQMFINRYRSFRRLLKENALHIMRAQEIVASVIVKEQLNFVGSMAIVSTLMFVSRRRSDLLLQRAVEKFSDQMAAMPARQKSTYHVARMLVAQKPAELSQALDLAAIECPQDPLIWLTFTKKMMEFQMLKFYNAMNILKTFLDQDPILIKDLVYHLLRPCWRTQLLKHFYDALAEKNLAKYYKTMFFEAYIRILFKRRHRNCDFEQIPWKFFSVSRPLKQLTNIETARYLFHNVQNVKRSVATEQTFLRGEASHKVSDFYDKYKQLEISGKLPTHTLLLTLVNAAFRSKRSTLWGEMYAAQVAIYEFKRHAAKNTGIPDNLDTANIFPRANLWTSYIRLLKKYRYVSELSEIIEWWENLKFIPPGFLLRHLLRALPPETSYRLILHNEKVLGDSGGVTSVNGWTWPTKSRLGRHLQEMMGNSDGYGGYEDDEDLNNEKLDDGDDGDDDDEDQDEDDDYEYGDDDVDEKDGGYYEKD